MAEDTLEPYKNLLQVADHMRATQGYVLILRPRDVFNRYSGQVVLAPHSMGYDKSKKPRVKVQILQKGTSDALMKDGKIVVEDYKLKHLYPLDDDGRTPFNLQDISLD